MAAVDPACVEKFPGQTWKCLIGEYAVPTITAPFVLHAFQTARFQLGFTAFGNWFLITQNIRDNKAYSDYAQSWRTRALLFLLRHRSEKRTWPSTRRTVTTTVTPRGRGSVMRPRCQELASKASCKPSCLVRLTPLLPSTIAPGSL